jgi:hypothetical protein
MATISERRLFDALATLSHACAEGGVPGAAEEGLAALDQETREGLGEAALAVAFGAFAAEDTDGGPMHMLTAALGLLAVRAGEEPDPPAEILGIAAEDSRVEIEIDRAGEAVDAEFGRDAPPEALTGALEARVLGTAITLAGCTLAEGEDGQAAVRLRAARCLVRLAAGLVAMNEAGGPAGNTPPPSAD